MVVDSVGATQPNGVGVRMESIPFQEGKCEKSEPQIEVLNDICAATSASVYAFKVFS